MCAEKSVSKGKITSLLESTDIIKIVNFLKAMANPTRIRIILALMERKLCTNKIAEMLNMSSSAVSHQLRLLLNLDIVRFERDGKNVYYTLADEHVRNIISMLLEHVAGRCSK
ncbi:MAG: ArsR/SmtB family transcription factor [Candidatus Njordarchaeum guaymaensis]